MSIKYLISALAVTTITSITAFAPVYAVNINSDNFTVAASRFICSEGGSVNLRSGPGQNFRVITSLSPGTPVGIISKQRGRDGRLWVRLNAYGRTGWVRTDFVC